MMAHLGPWDPVAGPASRTIAAGRSLVVYFLLDLGADKAPQAIEHTLHVIADDGGAHDIVLKPLAVSNEKPIVVAPPLRGVWMAGDSVNNGPDAAHRKAILITDGHAWLAQRYAIDWVQIQKVDGAYTTWKGAEDKNESYFCYGQPIYSVAAGKVVGMADGLPENVPHSGKYAVELSFDNAGGNHVVVEIAPHRYVLYAHMKPGTVRVKVGDTVGVGDLLGLDRQQRQLNRAASAHAYRRPAVVSCRQRPALRIHGFRRQRAGRSRRELADSDRYRHHRSAEAVHQRLSGKQRGSDVPLVQLIASWRRFGIPPGSSQSCGTYFFFNFTIARRASAHISSPRWTHAWCC